MLHQFYHRFRGSAVPLHRAVQLTQHDRFCLLHTALLLALPHQDWRVEGFRDDGLEIALPLRPSLGVAGATRLKSGAHRRPLVADLILGTQRPVAIAAEYMTLPLRLLRFVAAHRPLFLFGGVGSSALSRSSKNVPVGSWIACFPV